MSNALYSHLNASRREFRLLDGLHQDSASGELRCSMHVASLDDAEPFDALSYQWGPPDFDTSLIINGTEVKVTAHLAQAFSHFCKNQIGTTIPIWVDALCINQNDIPERNAQVAMMGELYKRASTVHVWLGNQDLAPRAGMMALEDFAAHVEHISGQHAHWPDNDHEARVEKKVSDLALITSNPYWRRTWILQEISFANKCTIHGGQEQVKLHGRYPIATLYDRLLNGNPQRSEPSRRAVDTWEPMAMAAWSARVTNAASKGDVAILRVVSELFTRLRHSQATDPRDKVYGMLGLLPRELLISPDYKKSTGQVYQEAALALIEMSRDLEILTQACSGDSTLPSWVPDYSQPSRSPVDLTKYLNSRRAGTLATMHADLKGYALQVKALDLDSIIHVIRHVKSSATKMDSLPSLAKLRELLDDHNQNQNVAEREYIFWRVACGGAIAQADFDLEELDRCKAAEARLQQDTELIDHLHNMQENCDYFMTAKGLAGLVPKDSIQLHDRLLVIAGAPTPYCASRIDEIVPMYSLRGACFVENNTIEPGELDLARPGIMNGGHLLAKAKCSADDKASIDALFSDVLIT